MYRQVIYPKSRVSAVCVLILYPPYPPPSAHSAPQPCKLCHMTWEQLPSLILSFTPIRTPTPEQREGRVGMLTSSDSHDMLQLTQRARLAAIAQETLVTIKFIPPPPPPHILAKFFSWSTQATKCLQNLVVIFGMQELCTTGSV